ncbi:MAG: enoyl-CoA hydratase-related protein [Burkholderiales bacterium]
MNPDCFELGQDAGVAHLKLARPERRNAMTAAFWQELPQIVRGLDAKVLVLSSTGPHFCGGLDISLFQGSSTFETNSIEGRKKFRQKLEELQDSLGSLADAPFPVIAAIQGGCIGGGVDMATACCLRYATRRAMPSS